MSWKASSGTAPHHDTLTSNFWKVTSFTSIAGCPSAHADLERAALASASSYTNVERVHGFTHYDRSLPLSRDDQGRSSRLDYAWENSIEIWQAASGGRLWTPTFQPSDVVIFSCWCIHTTWFEPGDDATRISLEYRLMIDDFVRARRDQSD
jgi:hypothetical protein